MANRWGRNGGGRQEVKNRRGRRETEGRNEMTYQIRVSFLGNSKTCPNQSDTSNGPMYLVFYLIHIIIQLLHYHNLKPTSNYQIRA